MQPKRLPLKETLAALPPEWPHDVLPAIRSALKQMRQKVVVLDDDPTGAQTVHDVPVLTEWSVDALADELAAEQAIFYVLTNTRSLPLAEAQALNIAIGRNLREAARRVGRPFVVVSRSDSTLRGHFPGEVEAIVEGLGQEFDAWVLAPFFLEGGRYTINDVHYVAEGDWLTPAGDTEFARDAAFPFRASNLRQWVEEKTAGRVRADAVASISIEDTRAGGPTRVAERLAELSRGAICFVNAASMRDLEVLNLGLLEAERRGKRFIYRTAASFIRARIGQSARPLLTAAEMGLPDTGGALIVVGSHVQRTTAQLAALLEQADVAGIEVRVDELLSEAGRWSETARAAREADRLLRSGSDVVVYTSRQPVRGASAEESLAISHRISEGLVAIVRAIATRPRYIIAKGGVTSSDLATQALNVRRCVVPGQALPGVPVWELGPESRFHGLKLIVFPGNVGGPQALAGLVASMKRSQ